MAREGKMTPVDPGAIKRVLEGVRYAVTGKRPTEWFGPNAPQVPQAQEQSRGRAFDYMPGYNLNSRPRQEEAVSFDDLRTLADGYDLLRLVIETRKDQIAKLDWTIQPRRKLGDAKPDANDARAEELAKFFRRPDKEHSWTTWLRMLLEDVFVIDAATLYPRKTLGGDLWALEIMDGSTIKRVLNEDGRTPIPPDTAYQQVLKGVAAADYTVEELLYLPRNPRPHKVYGQSPVEQIVMTVNIALRRQMSQLNYFTDRNIPEAIIGVPDNWTPEQIAQFQSYWDSLLEGNLEARRHAKFVPGGLNMHETRAPALNDSFDEWLARVVCYAFSVPPLPFVSQMNRASATSATDAALNEGLAPLMGWIKDMIDRVIEQYFGYADLEFKWGDHKEIDPASLASINSTYVRMGIKSIDEARAEIGLDPLGMDHAIFTGNGCVFIEELKDPEIRKQLMGMGAAPGAGGGYGAPQGASSGFDFMAQLMGSTADHESKDAGRRNTVLDLTSQDEGAVDSLETPGLSKRLPFSGYP